MYYRRQRLLGVIHLHLVRTIDLVLLILFEVDGSENLSVPAASLRLYYLQEQRRWAAAAQKPVQLSDDFQGPAPVAMSSRHLSATRVGGYFF